MHVDSPSPEIAERLPFDPSSPWWGQHLSRYRFAQQFAADARVLDVACGSGFGLSLLGECARLTVGVEIDGEAARQARSRARSDSQAVARADGCRLPFHSGSFSLITSFETLEHLHERPRFLGELRRVLAPGGTALISTPNAAISRPVNGKPRNPFHVHEYVAAELREELRAHFTEVQLVGQVLDGRFGISPFWLEQQLVPRTPRNNARLLARWVLHRLPPRARDAISQALWVHPFFPTEADFHFDLTGVERAPVLVAIARGAAA
jgi:SAM-dependent methyltransferase